MENGKSGALYDQEEKRVTTFPLEWRRKALHLSSLYIPLIYAFISRETALYIILPITFIFVFLDALRLLSRQWNASFVRLFHRLMREGEDKRLTGSSSFLIGCSFSILIFQKPVAIMAILILIISDTIAYIVGKRFGRIFIFNKTLEGSLSFFFSALLIGVIFPTIPLYVCILGAFTTTLAEALPLPIDDNIIIPLVAGATITPFL
jgi:dolichol kinase